ncbi:MAG TPA: hypothetical protein HA276_06940 [Candidatus Poseidoniaceae archaeon]|nr:MAG TPA: hypothetical protein D7I01_06825 [Candidatus Poseidoniales archaeon]HII97412.1 hypothetical protein [Candidatus Poseidoniaceae archaeon]
MADAQSYHDGLVAQGYSADQALAYTRQYYPDFTPAAGAPVAAAPAMPEAVQPAAVAPAAAQPMAQTMPAQAMPQPLATQTMPTQATAQPTVTGEGPSMLGWGAVGLIAMALLLSMVAQFNGAWLTGDVEGGLQISSGLSSVTYDCSGIGEEANQSICISSSAYLSTPMDETPPENSTEMVHKGTQAGACDRFEELTVNMATALSGGNQTVIDEATSAAADAKAECMISVEAGSKGGTWLWIGTVLALVCTVMAVLPKVGVDAIPSVVTDNARWGNMLAGVVIVLAVLLWRSALPDDPDSVMGASIGVYIAVVAGIMAIASGVLEVLDGRSGQA